MDEKVSYFKLRHDISILDLQKIIDFCEENNIKYKELYEYDLEQQISQLKQDKEDLIKKPKVIVQNKLKEITKEYHRLDKKNLSTANIIAHQYNSMRTVLEEVLERLGE